MKRACHRVALALVLTLGSAAGARAAGDPVRLRASPPLAHGQAALPRIAAPADDAAAARINRALATSDKRFKAAAAACGNGDAERTVTASLAGARFLGLVAQDSWFCGAYPDTGTLALVYDLTSGRPVNWAALLPSGLAIQGSIDSHFDGTPIGMMRSKALTTLYWDTIKADPDAKDCEAIVTADDVAFQAWPDAKADAVALEPASLPHAEKACAITALVPTAALRRLGANAALLDDIDAAHARAK